MQVLDLIQGSPEWLAARTKYFTASEAPAMMGVSKYQTRSQLLKQKATGWTPEVDAGTQYLFDRGHAVEAAARPIAEKTLGDLFPITACENIEGLSLLASVDGITMDESILWENKLFNQDLCLSIECGDPGYHIWQLEQQLLVTGASKVWFTTSDGTVKNTVGCWYESVPARRAQLIAGWKQFALDLANYQHIEHATKPEAEVQEQLPAVVINVTGQLSASNLADVTPKFDAWLASVKTSLSTDQDFANGESNAKTSRATAKALKTKAKEIIAQVSDIGEAVRVLELYAEKFDALGLVLEKAVKSEKELIKSNLINAARDKLRDHCAKLDERIGKRYLPIVQGNWNEVVKNKRTIESLHNALDTELARAKIEASALADRIETNLKMHGLLVDYPFLFADMATLCLKENDDFAAVATARIQAHQAQEAARILAETARIAEQERVKAEAAATAKANAAIAEARQAEQDARNKAARETMDTMPVAKTHIYKVPEFDGAADIGRRALASEIVNDNADIERLRLDTLLNSLTANEISKVLRFVQDLCRQAA
jgi:predicted phage-related endonuclease